MKYFTLMITLMIGLNQVSEGSVVYYVLPTEPLNSCPIATNISCPSNQVCHTMDYLAEHRSHFFPRDYYHITLIFMCGVHNYTQDLRVQNHYSFIMKGETGAKKNTIISMLPQVKQCARFVHTNLLCQHQFCGDIKPDTALSINCCERRIPYNSKFKSVWPQKYQ